MAFFEVKELSKKFNNEDVLNSISFDLEEGEIMSIIGSSGAGKTTLLRCLTNLEQKDSGTIVMKNEEITVDKINTGLVFQSFNLFPQYTAFENVKMPLELKEKMRKKKKLTSLLSQSIDDEVASILKKVDLDGKAYSYPYQLSGGEKQRVAIARAMALKPDILCFDEPTSALDPQLTEGVLKIIKDLKNTLKMTMIIVTHDIQFAKKVSDRVLYINDGNVCEYGYTEQIFTNPKSEETKNFLKDYI